MKNKAFKFLIFIGIITVLLTTPLTKSFGTNSNNTYKTYTVIPLSGKDENKAQNVNPNYNDNKMPTKAVSAANHNPNMCRKGKYNGYNTVVCGNEKDQVISYKEFYQNGDIHYTEDYTWHSNGHLSITHTRDFGSGEGGDDFRTYNGNRCREKYNQISIKDGHRLWGWEHNYCHDNEPHYSTYRL